MIPSSVVELSDLKKICDYNISVDIEEKITDSPFHWRMLPTAFISSKKIRELSITPPSNELSSLMTLPDKLLGW